jgi:hypothetical protein
MSQTTALIGPYDKLQTHEKLRAQVGIPRERYDLIFNQLLIYRGAQDKILARLFHTFDTILNECYPNIFDFTLAQREEAVNKILNDILQYSYSGCIAKFLDELKHHYNHDQPAPTDNQSETNGDPDSTTRSLG